MTEASCAKCHKQQVYVPKAENLNLAYATYERAGCYACHKTKGFDTDVKKPGPILTKIDSKLTARLGQDVDSQSESREAGDLDAARLVQLELQLAGRRGPQRSRDQRGGRVSVRQHREARVRRQEPAARRCGSRRADREGGVGDRPRDRLPGLPRGRRRHARSGGPAPHLRPAAGEHRQQDDLRVGVQLGPRSETLQPGHLHAGPAPDRRAGRRRGDLPDDAEAGRRRRRRQGHLHRPARQRCAARLLQGVDAVRGGQGADRQTGSAGEADRARPARDRPLRLLQLPRHQGVREGAADRHRPVGRGQQAGHAPRLRVHHRHPAYLEARLVPDQAARPAHLRQGARAPAARQAADAELRADRRGERAPGDGDHELPARAAAAGRARAALGAVRFPRRRPDAGAPAQLRRVSRSSRATAATSSSWSPTVRSARRCSRRKARASSPTGCTRSSARRSRSARG